MYDLAFLYQEQKACFITEKYGRWMQYNQMQLLEVEEGKANDMDRDI